MTLAVSSLGEFEATIHSTPNAFIAAGWCGTREAEEELKKKYGYTIRCIPFTAQTDFETCFLTGAPIIRDLVAKSY